MDRAQSLARRARSPSRQVAEELHLDFRTVETCRARINEKLNLPDANELLQYAIRWMLTAGS